MDLQLTKPSLFSFLLLLLSFLLLTLLIPPLKPIQNTLFPPLPNQSCDYTAGKWIPQPTPLPYTEDCPFLDQGFKCHQNGKKNDKYWKWQPNGCTIPTFNGSDFLHRSRNGRIIFAGDSLGRNQWESLVCMLAESVNNKSTIYEQNGKSITKHKGFLSILFQDYNLTVEYYRVPFLVVLGHPPKNSPDKIRSAVKISKLHWYSKKWIGADVLVFNVGHWWNQERMTEMKQYFQQGETINITMTLQEAFRGALQTWKEWVIRDTDRERSNIFFRSISPTHFTNGDWNSGGSCNQFDSPASNYSNQHKEAWKNTLIYETIQEMKNVEFFNVTYLTEFRVDGHPSIYREEGRRIPMVQDCSHWCLPGVPDTWNHLLYARLLSRDYRTDRV